MKLDSNTIEKIFIPAIATLVAGGISSHFKMHTDMAVLKTKVGLTQSKFVEINRRIDEIKQGQKDIVKLLMSRDRHETH